MNTVDELNYLLDKKTKFSLVILFIMSIFGSLAELLGISIILPVVDLAMETDPISTNDTAHIIQKYTGAQTKEQVILWLIAATILVYLLKNAYMCFMYNRQFRFSAYIKRDMATRLMSSYLKQPYSFFLQKNSSELIRSVSTDTNQLFQLVNNILTIFSNSLTAVCIIIFLAVSNFWMTITVAAILGLCLVIIIFGLQKKNRQNGIINQKAGGLLIKYLQQSFEGIKEIKIMNTEKEFISLYDETYTKCADLEVRYSIYNTMPKYLIEVFAMTAILSFLGANIIYNPNYMALLPQLAVFCVAALKLLPAVNQIYASFNVIMYHKASIDVVYRDIKEADDLLKSYKDVEDGVEEIEFNDKIETKDLCFRYEGMDNDVISNINITIPKGKSVALIGPSGGGKTTMADLILTLLHPTSGKIEIDGNDIERNLWGWRKKIGYIPQTIYLIDDSIRKNIAFGILDDEIDDEQVWKVLEDAQLKEFVESLPNGLGTVVGERGARISGGQRQRIGIARALYRNPEMLVFDEATSALDNETEKEVMRAVDGLQGTKTILMIAHRLSTIKNCDIIYKVEKGTVEEVDKAEIE